MKKRYRSTLALIICVIMTLPALYAGIAAAEEEKPGFLGQPFPEFTAADTEENTFTLSEALNPDQFQGHLVHAMPERIPVSQRSV